MHLLFTPIAGYICPKCARTMGAITPSGNLVLCIICPWTEMTMASEQIAKLTDKNEIWKDILNLRKEIQLSFDNDKLLKLFYLIDKLEIVREQHE